MFSRTSVPYSSWVAALVLSIAAFRPADATGQHAVEPRGSDNIDVIAHIPLGAPFTVQDVELEQELDRPFAYVSRRWEEAGFEIIDISDPAKARVIFSWRIESPELHQGGGGRDGKYFKVDDRYYYVQSFQFGQGGMDHDLGAVVFDVTGLPDASKVREVARIREPETPRGFHNIFMYKHSDGRALLLTTVSGPFANVYDMGRLVREGPENARVARIPVPTGAEGSGVGIRGYHDLYAAYHPASGQDRFYGGGAGGYYVYDISDLENPALLTSITGVPGVRWGHTFTPTPDGRYAVAETEYQYAPLRIFDLQPGLDGEVATIRLPIGAWTADWKNLAHNHEVRYPYVFVSAYEDGLQVFNMQDPTDPFTVAYYDTYLGPHKVGTCADRICNGAFGVDVRNADGLIAISDGASGFWAFRMEGFQGWDGRGWGMPNISSVQNWDEGPPGADRAMTRSAVRETGDGSR
jgi:hypothetical protein